MTAIRDPTSFIKSWQPSRPLSTALSTSRKPDGRIMMSPLCAAAHPTAGISASATRKQKTPSAHRPGNKRKYSDGDVDDSGFVESSPLPARAGKRSEGLASPVASTSKVRSEPASIATRRPQRAAARRTAIDDLPLHQLRAIGESRRRGGSKKSTTSKAPPYSRNTTDKFENLSDSDEDHGQPARLSGQWRPAPGQVDRGVQAAMKNWLEEAREAFRRGQPPKAVHPRDIASPLLEGKTYKITFQFHDRFADRKVFAVRPSSAILKDAEEDDLEEGYILGELRRRVARHVALEAHEAGLPAESAQSSGTAEDAQCAVAGLYSDALEPISLRSPREDATDLHRDAPKAIEDAQPGRSTPVSASKHARSDAVPIVYDFCDSDNEPEIETIYKDPKTMTTQEGLYLLRCHDEKLQRAKMKKKEQEERRIEAEAVEIQRNDHRSVQRITSQSPSSADGNDGDDESYSNDDDWVLSEWRSVEVTRQTRKSTPAEVDFSTVCLSRMALNGPCAQAAEPRASSCTGRSWAALNVPLTEPARRSGPHS